MSSQNHTTMHVLSEPHDDAFRGWTTAYYVRPVKTTPYYVRLINGKVESYGRTGDFDSTKNSNDRELPKSE
jgi:hypothetical protein